MKSSQIVDLLSRKVICQVFHNACSGKPVYDDGDQDSKGHDSPDFILIIEIDGMKCISNIENRAHSPDAEKADR